MRFFSIFFFCVAAFVVQQGESITPIWVVGSSTTVSLGGLIAGGLLLKAGAAAVFGLVHLASRGRRGKREIADGLQVDETDLEILQKEAEAIFTQLDESDPAHCFRRYICELSTGNMENVSEEHNSFLHLVSQPLAVHSKAFEYRIASSIGSKTKSTETCQQLYQCPLSGSEIDKIFV